MLLGVLAKNRGNRRRYLVVGGCHHTVVGPTAAALASLIVEPIPAMSSAAAANICGCVITSDIVPSFPTAAVTERLYWTIGQSDNRTAPPIA
jgi:hypothetical protein